MAWCREATSHYPSQCRPRFMSLYGITRPQLVNLGTNFTLSLQWTLRLATVKIAVSKVFSKMKCFFFYSNCSLFWIYSLESNRQSAGNDVDNNAGTWKPVLMKFQRNVVCKVQCNVKRSEKPRFFFFFFFFFNDDDILSWSERIKIIHGYRYAPGIILCMRPVNERRRYNVWRRLSLAGRMHGMTPVPPGCVLIWVDTWIYSLRIDCDGRSHAGQANRRGHMA